ncbi:MAG TPA: M48 family metalloprotease [Blastocatellia bacterium]|jgi:Zn-dependent protease with chaperone function|nr:M48 family metalloprotease [Blastocatellia bacterium]
MFWRITGRLACIVVVSFSQAVGAALVHREGEIEQALAAIGSGPTEEMKSRLFSERITVFDDSLRARAVATLPASVRGRRITQGKLLRRVEAVFNRVLRLHGRSGKLELFLYRNDLPSTMLWRGCVVAVSDSLAETLYDDELAGALTHELGHSYFEDEMAEARRTQNVFAMRVIELKCDGVAILSLKLLGRGPVVYVRGLQRLQLITKRKGLSDVLFQSHPTLVERMIFSKRLIESLD